MKHILSLLALLFAFAAHATPPTLPGRLVFKLKPGQRPAALEATLRELAAKNLEQKFPRAIAPSPERPGGVELRNIYQIDVPLMVTLAQARAALLASGLVEYVEPLYVRQPQYQPTDPMSDSTRLLATGPVAQAGQTYLKQIKAYRAWDITRGDTSIVIGITDSGIRLTHEDLRQQVKHNYADPINGVDDDHDGFVDNFTGWDLANHDNDSGFDPTLIHGSFVAGVAAARADNGVGIAGVGNKCKFMPLNIYANTGTGAFAGYEAIAYAADHGCQVIVMSWGSPGSYSRFEQDVCTYAAVNRDAVLVAAAGNTNADLRFYPASYDHVISVTGVFADDTKGTGFTYSNRVDLSAPGQDILTTYGYGAGSTFGALNADYVAVPGTSFSAPQVAGAAALVRWRFPNYNSAQVAAQLRRTTDNVYQLPGNAAYLGKLGTGRLNMARALGQANVREARVVASVFHPARPAYSSGQLVTLRDTVQNLLAPLSNLIITLTTTSPYLTITQGTASFGNLATLARSTNTATPFAFTVASTGIPLNTVATLHYHLTASNGYQSDDYVDVTLNPDYVVLDANNLALTLTSRGKLGFDDLAGTIGTGLNYLDGPPLLSEGGLLLATTPTRVSDRLRAVPRGSTRQSFFTATTISRQAPGPRADQEARAVFQDTVPVAGNRIRSVGVQVKQRAYAWATPSRRDFVLLEYSLKNITTDTLKPLFAGIFADWDLPGESGRNIATYDSARALGYAYDPAQPRVYAGVRWLRGGQPAVYSINNGAPAGTPVRLADGFSLAEKFLTLSCGTARANRTAGAPGGADVSQVVGLRLAKLAPGDSTTVAFAVLAAPTLPALQAAADAASLALANILPARAAAAEGSLSVFPNPASGPLRVQVPAKFGLSEVRLINTLGQTVLKREAQGTAVDLSVASLPPGLYTLRAEGRAGVLTRAVVVR